MTPTPHDFLLHMRTHRPALARRLDGVRGLEKAHGRLLIRAPEGSWSYRELTAQAGELAAEARRLFGPGVDVEVTPTEPAPEALPFPVLASKVWNHVAFWAWSPSGSCLLAVPKPRYLEAWLPTAASQGDNAVSFASDPTASWIPQAPCEPTGELPGVDALCGLVERLCEVARAARSYAHLVAAFPGDDQADRLEARLFAVKEWGTPRIPAGVLQKFVGRLHYVDPTCPVLGVRLANRAS